MRPIIAAILMAALTVPAYSQSGIGAGGPGGRGGRPPSAPAVDPEKKKAEDKAFNDAVKRIPLPEKKYDPWSTVRELPKH